MSQIIGVSNIKVRPLASTVRKLVSSLMVLDHDFFSIFIRVKLNAWHLFRRSPQPSVTLVPARKQLSRCIGAVPHLFFLHGTLKFAKFMNPAIISVKFSCQSVTNSSKFYNIAIFTPPQPNGSIFLR